MASLDPFRKEPAGSPAIKRALPIIALVLLGLLPFLSVLFSDKILFASDQIGSPAWRFFFEALRKLQIPWWDPYALSGIPTFDAGFGDGSYVPFLLLGMILPVTHVVTYSFILHVLIAGLSAYALVRRFFGLERLASLALAAAYMLNTNFISHIHAGHTGKFYIMAWLPLSLYFLLRCLGSKTRWYHLLGLALTIALFISTSHLQFTYYVLMGYFLVWAFRAFAWLRAKDYRAAALGAGKFWLPILLGLGLAFPIFYPPIQFNKEFSVRGQGEKQTFEHAASWSMHPEEAMSLAVPEFTGLNEHYWGRNPFKLNSEYPGLGLLFLGVFGLAAFRRKWLWFWAAVGLLSLLYALGADTPFFRLFYAVVPGIKNFRAPSMMLFWLITALMMMSAQTLAILFREVPSWKAEQRGKLAKRLLQVGLGAAGALLLCGVGAGAVYGIWNSLIDASAVSNIAQQAANTSSFGAGALKNAVLLAAMVLGVWKWGVQDSRPGQLSLLLLAIICVDLYWTNKNFILEYEPDRFFPHEAAADFLEQQKEPLRVFGLPGSYERGYMQYHEISSADGFVDNENRIYQDFRGGDDRQNANLMHGLKQNPDGSVMGSAFLDLLNVKYLAYRLQSDPGLRLAENKSALPRAWFLRAWETRPDSTTLSAMLDPAFQPDQFAYVSAGTPIPDAPALVASGGSSAGAATVADSAGKAAGPAADSAAKIAAAAKPAPQAEIRETARDNNRLGYSVRNSARGLLMLSEIYFPHWKARVDGKDQTVLRVDYALRGIALEPGDHTIELYYSSPWINKGLLISALCLALLAAMAGGFHAFGPRPAGRDRAAAR